MRYASRNEALGFALRTRKNLKRIDDAYAAHDDVHPVTQLVNSLLGLVVIPRERHLVSQLGKMDLEVLVASGWPKWTFEFGSCDTLEDLMRRLRNSIAHGHFEFSSESTDLNAVTISVEDYKSRGAVLIWRAKISAVDLKDFCLRFIELVEQVLG